MSRKTKYELMLDECLISFGNRKCNECLNVFELNSFERNSSDRFGYHCKCKTCKRKNRGKGRNWKHRELEKENKKKCSLCNVVKPLIAFPNESDAYKGKRANCKLCDSARKQNWKEGNREKVAEAQKRYINKRPENKLHSRMGSAIREQLKGLKNDSWINYVDYSVEDLKNHLESLFKEGMSWDNYGIPESGYFDGWHIDHIKPKSWFNFNSPEDESFKKCWSLENLQPLWAEENLRKNNRYEG